MKKGKISLKRGLIGVLAFAILLVSTSWVYAGWIVVSPPEVSRDWTLYGVHFTSADEGWAVGSDYHNDKGVLLHFSGDVWTSVTPPPVSLGWELFSVHFTSSTEGWAVGRDNSNKKGVLLHYSSGSWASVPPPTVSSLWHLNSVYFPSATEGWAVGVDDSASVANSGVLLHYLNGSWSVVAPPVHVSSSWALNGLHFTSPDEGWAVGDDKSFLGGGVLLHYLNGLWGPVTPPNAGTNWDLKSVYFTSSDEGWAIGNDYQFPVKTGLLFHYTGGTWTPFKPTHSSLSWYLLDGYFISSTEGWVVGNDVPSLSTEKGLLLHYLNGSWSFVNPPQASTNWELSGVHFTSSGEGWAVGGDNRNGRGVLLQYTNLPDITVTPASVDFGSVSAGKISKKTINVKNDGALNLTLQTIGNPADAFSRIGGSCRNNTVLIPGGRCSIVVQFAPAAEGLLTSDVTIASDDPDEPSVTVNLAGRSGPAELTGAWDSLTQTCTSTPRGIRCRLNGTLVVENTGYKDIPSLPYAYVYFYLSDDGSYDPGVDTYLKRKAIGKVRFDNSKNAAFTFRFPLGATGSGKHIIAVLDANNKVTELNETNNTVVSDVIPAIP